MENWPLNVGCSFILKNKHVCVHLCICVHEYIKEKMKHTPHTIEQWLLCVLVEEGY